ncbi:MULTISPECIES: haloalkane dehalogenase [unclassified Ensifer]|uniref:haloalkane dehalogenase n=1 Tax=unclassified Ensifer TaxID=2633371 RepID=UPI0008136C53|nr:MULTISPECIES: haloalkane dehalogenase [unclassified Ensifer]OCO98140.1 haloalkane dehalogenase [Ensifer sp. LC11]OCO98633.1 haloalkane dehalogenase [Ensifer sp. LC13]OCP04303.1 haloalkane dehalogenase [Ensifer sp. LC14]OCP29295.1 haloalkane dehalogenase [Ensifer sp. LC499]
MREEAFAAGKSFVDVLGSSMAYVDQGAGPTVLFLHGNPTSSYIWRNILPHVASVGRCVAPDLIGYGHSAKPDIDYSFLDQFRYLEAFIEKVAPGPLFLVAQDWGTALAFHLAARHPEQVLGLAFMEYIRPAETYERFHQKPQARELFKAFRTPGVGERLILEENVFIERVVPNAILRGLTDEEMAAYRAPFPDPPSRRPVLRLPRELPIEGAPSGLHAISTADHAVLRASRYPKLLFSGDPGALISPAEAEAYAGALTHCRLVKLGAGAHYLQEDHPDAIGISVRAWIEDLQRVEAA